MIVLTQELTKVARLSTRLLATTQPSGCFTSPLLNDVLLLSRRIYCVALWATGQHQATRSRLFTPIAINHKNVQTPQLPNENIVYTQHDFQHMI
jgi:hypothetical protein